MDGAILPRHRDDVMIIEHPFDLVIYDEQTHRVHVLNHSSKVIWECCDGTRSLEDVISALQTTFEDVAREQLVKDVHATLDKLHQENLLQK